MTNGATITQVESITIHSGDAGKEWECPECGYQFTTNLLARFKSCSVCDEVLEDRDNRDRFNLTLEQGWELQRNHPGIISEGVGAVKRFRDGEYEFEDDDDDVNTALEW